VGRGWGRGWGRGRAGAAGGRAGRDPRGGGGPRRQSGRAPRLGASVLAAHRSLSSPPASCRRPAGRFGGDGGRVLWCGAARPRGQRQRRSRGGGGRPPAPRCCCPHYRPLRCPLRHHPRRTSSTGAWPKGILALCLGQSSKLNRRSWGEGGLCAEGRLMKRERRGHGVGAGRPRSRQRRQRRRRRRPAAGARPARGGGGGGRTSKSVPPIVRHSRATSPLPAGREPGEGRGAASAGAGAAADRGAAVAVPDARLFVTLHHDHCGRPPAPPLPRPAQRAPGRPK
jgi:hypothetical protein